MSACSTLQVPAARPSFHASEFTQAEAGGIVLRARPIVGKDSYSQLFDDDLERMGIVAVWVSVENRSGQDVALDPGKWLLWIGERRDRALAPGDMVGRYYEERRIRFYTVHADDVARERLGNLCLQRGKIVPGAVSDGFVFFGIDGPAPPSWNSDARLVAQGIRVGGKGKLELQLPLYAHS